MKMKKKNISDEKIEQTIQEAPAGTPMKGIAKMLGVQREDISYHFKNKPFLREQYQSIHGKIGRIKKAIISARKNATAIEIARSLNMSKYAFNGNLSYHPELRELFNGIHGTKNKIHEATLEKICNAITNAPKGMPIQVMEKKYNLAPMWIYFKKDPELKKLYLSIHGDIGKSKSWYIKNQTENIKQVIENSPKGSFISDIAREIQMDENSVRLYLKKHPELKELYHRIHGNPKPHAKGITKKDIYAAVGKIEMEEKKLTTNMLSQELGVSTSMIRTYFKKYPELKELYKRRRGN